MKNFARITMLSFWLFAIVAPSVITLFDVDNPVIVTNLNEEEQQEQGKKSVDEKQLIDTFPSHFAFLSKLRDANSYDFYFLSNSDYLLEVVLPPPEQV